MPYICVFQKSLHSYYLNIWRMQILFFIKSPGSQMSIVIRHQRQTDWSPHISMALNIGIGSSQQSIEQCKSMPSWMSYLNINPKPTRHCFSQDEWLILNVIRHKIQRDWCPHIKLAIIKGESSHQHGMENIVISKIRYLNSNSMTTGDLLFILSFICIWKNPTVNQVMEPFQSYQIYTLYITKDPINDGYIYKKKIIQWKYVL